MRFKKQFFGTLSNGQRASLFTVCKNGISMSATDFGCALTSLIITDPHGKQTDVVLGFSTLDGYARSWGSFGSVIGRYSNKINGASFSLNGKKFQLFDNCGGSCLHGGFPRWENTLWKGKFIQRKGASGIQFTNVFPDGYQGFPGTLSVTVEYLIDKKAVLTMCFRAETDKATPVSITNHSYFNLSSAGDIRKNVLQLFCSKVLETTDGNIPTGTMLDVRNTPYDFLEPKEIGSDFDKIPEGYDDCFVTDAFSSESGIPSAQSPLVRVAELTDFSSRIKMSVSSNAEGVQLYTAQFVKYLPGKYGACYMPFNAVCLETQNFPDSPNRPEFPSVILNPGQVYTGITEYKFSFF